jgi:TetR/AcrR family transcriptional regulator
MPRTLTKSSPARPRRRPGRPGGAAHTEAVRAALLTAARALFAAHDFEAVSVRDIARAAQVNPAMVHYHFGDKQGLYRAMLQETLGPVLARLQEALLAPSTEATEPVAELLRAVMTTMAREPWVPRLIVREVLAEQGAFHDMFIREFAARGGGRLPVLLKREMAEGRVRSDLDPILGALSLMSLALFPFIALPVAQQLFGIRMTDAFVTRLVEHNARLYCDGVRATPVAAPDRNRRS